MLAASGLVPLIGIDRSFEVDNGSVPVDIDLHEDGNLSLFVHLGSADAEEN